jgi:hypothetical protein
MSEKERQEWMSIPQDFAPAKKSKVNRFAGIPVPDFVEMILKGDDEAMYYLLHDRLKHPLHERYEAYSNHLCDDYEDVIDDFFRGAVVLPFTGKVFRPVFLWMNQRKTQHRDEFQLHVVA